MVANNNHNLLLLSVAPRYVVFVARTLKCAHQIEFVFIGISLTSLRGYKYSTPYFSLQRPHAVLFSDFCSITTSLT
jgi:hypothetical protein